MPTKYDRILVRKDPELDEALRTVASLTGSRSPAATLVHDLAIRGARALIEDERGRAQRLDRMIARSTSEDPGFDPQVLARVDQEAWGQR